MGKEGKGAKKKENNLQRSGEAKRESRWRLPGQQTGGVALARRKAWAVKNRYKFLKSATPWEVRHTKRKKRKR